MDGVGYTYKGHVLSEKEQDLSPLPCPLPAFRVVENFSQRVSLIREMRNAETKEKSQRRQTNNNVVIQDSQRLVLSQGL